MPFLLCAELQSDGSLWAVANGPSMEDLKKHISTYAGGTTFTVYEVAADFDFKQRLSPPVSGLEPCFTFTDGGSTESKQFLTEPVTCDAGGKARAEFTLAVSGLPATTHPVVGLFDNEGKLVGRTEVIGNTGSANFQKQFIVSGNPKSDTGLKFSVYNGASEITAATFLGCAQVPFKSVLNQDTTVDLYANDGSVVAGASLTCVKKPKAKKAPVPQQQKKKKDKKEKKEAPVDPKAAEKAIKAAMKEGGKKAQDICGLSDMGGVVFFHVSLDTPKADWDLLDTCLQGFNKEIDPEADDRKGGAHYLAKCLMSYNDEKLACLVHVPDSVMKEKSVEAKAWTDVILAAIPGGKYVSESANVIKIEAPADPDKGLFPIKMKDEAISKSYAWLQAQQLVLVDEESDDDMVWGDDDF